MTPTAIIDTNILVYTYDKQDPKRQLRARETLLQLRTTSAGYLSVKTLSEFFIVIRRIPHSLTNAEAFREVQTHAAIWPVLDLTPAIVIEAARGVRGYQFSYWDAQIWATAKLHRLNAIFTEDMNTGSTIEGVSIINPLADDFNFAIWLAQADK